MPEADANSQYLSSDRQEDDKALKVVGFGFGFFQWQKFPTPALLVVFCSDKRSVARLASSGHIHRPGGLVNWF